MEAENAMQKWYTRKRRLHDADDLAVDRAMVADMPMADRVALVWHLTLHMGKLTGVDYSEQRLQRRVARLERRGG